MKSGKREREVDDALERIKVPAHTLKHIRRSRTKMGAKLSGQNQKRREEKKVCGKRQKALRLGPSF